MVAEPIQAIKIFYCYAHEDRRLRDELDKHLAALKRLGQITGWHDREIQAGTDWEREINMQLNTSNIILLLISADFISSDYCYSVEMQRALKLHQTGYARVIPIILRPVDWQGTPLATLQMLPTGAKPITSWANRDEAFKDVVKHIRLIVNTLLTKSERIANNISTISGSATQHALNINLIVKIVFDRISPYRRQYSEKSIIYGTIHKNGTLFYGEGHSVQMTMENHSEIPVMIYAVDLIIKNYDDDLLEDYSYSKIEISNPLLEIPGTMYREPIGLTCSLAPGNVIAISNQRFGLEAKGVFTAHHTLEFTVVAYDVGLWRYYIRLRYGDLHGTRKDVECVSDVLNIVKG